MTTYEYSGAVVECTHVPGGYAGTSYYIVTGSRDAVTAAIDQIKGAYPPAGYGTWFNWPPPPDGPSSPWKAPVETEPGVWRAKGHHSNSCD